MKIRKNENPTIFQQIVNFAAVSARQFSSSSVRQAAVKGEVPEGFHKLKEIQARFQVRMSISLISQQIDKNTLFLEKRRKANPSQRWSFRPGPLWHHHVLLCCWIGRRWTLDLHPQLPKERLNP
jgi:hypothetical protein